MLVATGEFVYCEVGRRVTKDVRATIGPQLTSGSELAQAAPQALGTKMEFESIEKCIYALVVYLDSTVSLESGTGTLRSRYSTRPRVLRSTKVRIHPRMLDSRLM